MRRPDRRIYTSHGFYTARLTVGDDHGNIGIDTIEIAVTAPLPLIDLGDRTRDQDTGLDWLDVTQTKNLSYEAILGGAGGWNSEGWRHATLAEVCDLFARHAVAPADPCGSGSASEPGEGVRALQALLGLTRTLPGQQEDTFGFVDNGTAGPSVGRARLTYNTASDSSTAGVEASSAFGRTDALATHGHFLVRPYAAPVPAMQPFGLHMLLAGLLVGAGLLMMRRRGGRP